MKAKDGGLRQYKKQDVALKVLQDQIPPLQTTKSNAAAELCSSNAALAKGKKLLQEVSQEVSVRSRWKCFLEHSWERISW